MQSSARRRVIGTTAAVLGAAALPRAALSQSMLESVRVITGFTPGGTSDTLCRRVADRLRGNYAKVATVENRSGAGGQIAIEQMKVAPADGSVILQTPASMLMIYPYIYRKLNYDPFTDVTPASLGCTFTFGWAVGPMVPDSVRNVADFVRWCKANPSQANFGSPAAGSIPHFIGSLLDKAAGVELKHVAFRGTQPAILDMVGGQIAAVSGPVGEFTQHVKAGKARLLATTGTERSRFAPDVPTFIEQGFRTVEAREWMGFFLPGRTPPEIVQRANAALRAALAAPEVIDGLAVMGLEAASSTPAELARMLRSDYERWGPIVKATGFTIET